MLVVEEFERLNVIRVSRWIFNCYLLLQPDGVIVIDAGLPRVVEDIAPPLRRKNLHVKSIIATHGHSDHLGGASRLAQRYHGCPVYIPAQTLHYIRDPRPSPRTPSFRSTTSIWRTLFDQPFDWRALGGLISGSFIAGFGPTSSMRWTGAAPTGALIEGEQVPGAAEWIVVSSAGHTDDSISFWHAPTGTLLCGDAIVTANGKAHFTNELVDRAKARLTQQRLLRLPVKHLLPGHGRPVHADNVWNVCERYSR